MLGPNPVAWEALQDEGQPEGHPEDIGCDDCCECKRKVGMMKTYNVVTFLNIEAEFQVECEDEDQAMRIMNERLEGEDPLGLLRESGYVTVGDSGAVDCWEMRED